MSREYKNIPGTSKLNTRGATRIDAQKVHPLLKILSCAVEVFPSLLLISNALSVGDAFSLTDFPQKPSLHRAL